MTSVFPPFQPKYQPYPQKVANVTFQSPSYPTNSWMENALNNQINDYNRVTNAIPWYWTPIYPATGSNSTYSIGLSYTNITANLAHTTTDGNIIIQENPASDLVVTTTYAVGVTSASSSGGLFLTAMDDYTAAYTQMDGSGNTLMTGYPMRGSPYATFVYNNSEIFIGFNQNASGITVSGEQLNPNLIRYTVDVFGQANTEYNTSFQDITTPVAGIYTTRASFYDHMNDTGMTVSAQYINNGLLTINATLQTGITSGSTIVYETVGITLSIIIGSTNVYGQTFPTGISNINIGNNATFSYTSSIVINTTDSRAYTIQPNLTPNATPYVITLKYAHPQTYRWYIYTGATLVQSSNNVMTTSAFTGVLQIASGGIDVSQYSNTQQLYDAYAGGYVTGGAVGNYQGALILPWSFDIDWVIGGTGSLGSILWMLPNHWNLMSYSAPLGNTAMAPITTNVFLQNCTYGNLTFYSIFSATNTVTIDSGTIIPAEPNISGLGSTGQTALAEQLNVDIPYLIKFYTGAAAPAGPGIGTATDPYGYGTFAAAYARLLVFASLLGILDEFGEEEIAAEIAILSWLIGVNSIGILPPNTNVFQIQRESTWGGIIVPADYLVQAQVASIGSFGNSFYNDHHFHWGYLLYTIYASFLVGGISFDPYLIQITEIVKDICNPVVDFYAWKTRHKDWYGGHSWATGVDNEVNRQQESSGEAINAYYAAYLVSQFILVNPTLASTAGVCMWLEILASQQYYQMYAPGARIGVMSNVGNVGIILTQGKALTLDWAMQPNNFNGRAIGMYGIQTLPYTEITAHLLQTQNNYWQSILPNLPGYYALTPYLVTSLNSRNFTPVYPPNGNNLIPYFNPQIDGVFWGLVGLKILAYSNTAISNSDITAAYNNATSLQKILPQSSIVKQFDTFSNTLYLLQVLRGIIA